MALINIERRLDQVIRQLGQASITAADAAAIQRIKDDRASYKSRLPARIAATEAKLARLRAEARQLGCCERMQS